MKLAHNIGDEKHPNYNTIEDILLCKDEIGFDGIYKNVFNWKRTLKDKKGIFFVMGDYVGKDNTFDLEFVPKLEEYCTWDEIFIMTRKYNFELGWHTWSHPDLTLLSKEEIIKEITPPFYMKYFAYPYGKFNDLVIECVKEVGFEKAWSVTQGSQDENEIDHKYKIYRDYI
jgi:peptidoglycan/xylan/chitin deacetylase (PgdA/CDA1 family)